MCSSLSVNHEEFGQEPEMGPGHRAELGVRTINICRERLSSNDIHKVPGLTMMVSCLYVCIFSSVVSGYGTSRKRSDLGYVVLYS